MSKVDRHISWNVTTSGAKDAMLWLMAVARCEGGTSQSRFPRPYWSQALKSQTRSRSDAADAADGWTSASPTISATRMVGTRVERVIDIPGPPSAVAARGDRDVARAM